ncbi:unnamed protein product [Penicillium salamii]|nr:unnamed protein product [Penicillium salamii]
MAHWLQPLLQLASKNHPGALIEKLIEAFFENDPYYHLPLMNTHPNNGPRDIPGHSMLEEDTLRLIARSFEHLCNALGHFAVQHLSLHRARAEWTPRQYARYRRLADSRLRAPLPCPSEDLWTQWIYAAATKPGLLGGEENVQFWYGAVCNFKRSVTRHVNLAVNIMDGEEHRRWFTRHLTAFPAVPNGVLRDKDRRLLEFLQQFIYGCVHRDMVSLQKGLPHGHRGREELMEAGDSLVFS